MRLCFANAGSAAGFFEPEPRFACAVFGVLADEQR